MTYTPELTELIVSEYEAEPTRETVDRLAEEHNKSPRSIIAKLASAGVYKAPQRVTKLGEPIVKKEEMASDIGTWLGIDVPTLVKASKFELKALHNALSNADIVRAHLVDLEFTDE